MKQKFRLVINLFICIGLCFGLIQVYFSLDTINAFAAAPDGYPLPITLGVGSAHGCAIRPDGTLACWGYMDNWGGYPIPEGTFSHINAGDGFYCGITNDGVLDCWGDAAYGVMDNIPSGIFKQVNCGMSHSCAIRSNGTVTCWGDNWTGQSTPPSGTFNQVTVNGEFGCGIRTDGTLACWGSTDYGILSPPGGTFLQISAGATHVCGLKTDGTLACWGHGQAGSTTPPTGTFTRLNAGWKHNCAIRTDGTLACWGYNFSGQATPPSGTFVQVGGGWEHTCGLRENGSIECWGWNFYGQSSPPAGNFGRAQVAAGYDHTCGILSHGELACWGTDVSEVGVLDAPTGTFKQISTKYKTNCGLRSDGTLACWGENEYFQSTPPTTGTFRQVTIGMDHACAIQHDGTIVCWGRSLDNMTTPPSGIFKQINAGIHHTCGIQSNGEVACWGQNYSGQITPPDGVFIQISSGSIHTCGLRENGVIECWGNNENGQAPERTDPIYIQVVAGWEHTCGIRGDLQVDCWGLDDKGQATPPAGRFIQLSASLFHTCGVKTNGNYICWGDNSKGQFPPNPPSFTSNPITAATQDIEYVYDIISVDPDTGDTLAITYENTLPDWLELDDQGDGSATLAGTPTNADVGNHPITLVVTDISGLTDSQDFTIVVTNVNDPPEFTSMPEITVDEGALYEYFITATDPDLIHGDTISITATDKPDWLTLDITGIGSATLWGTPERADVGEHDVILRVTDSFSDYVEQPFTISVAQTTEPPEITSYPDPSVIFMVGESDAEFLVETTGTPTPVITIEGDWADGVDYIDNGNGRARIFGEPESGTGGIYPLTIKASNGVEPDATQAFTLIVATAVVVDGTEEEISSSSGDILITIPSGAVDGEATFTFVPQAEPYASPGSLSFAGISFRLTAENSDGIPITEFAEPLIITITYDPDALDGIDSATLRVYYWDAESGEEGEWLDANCDVDGYQRGDPDLEQYWFSLKICHLSEFAVLGEAGTGYQIFLPLILR